MNGTTKAKIAKTYAMYNRPISDDTMRLFEQALSKHTDEQIERAIDAHLADPEAGRFAPLPAHIVAQIEAAAGPLETGRPGAEAAFGFFVQSMDENAYVWLTDEISEASANARLIWEAGDKVGARMAFREDYIRAMDRAKMANRPVKWTLSQGMTDTPDKQGYRRAIEDGARFGYLKPETAADIILSLPAPRQFRIEGHTEGNGIASAVAGLLESNDKPTEVGRKHIEAIRAMLRGDRKPAQDILRSEPK